MFRITIEEITTVPDVKQEWRLLETDGKYGYVPAAPGATHRESRAVLTQEVEMLDVAAVVRAVNNL